MPDHSYTTLLQSTHPSTINDDSYTTFSISLLPSDNANDDTKIDEKHISFSEYNKIPLITDQNATLDRELDAAGITAHDLFQKLFPESDNHLGLALCLVHRHCELSDLKDVNNTERMVSRNAESCDPNLNENKPVSISEPCAVNSSTNRDANNKDVRIFPARWLSDGTIFEYTRNSHDIAPTQSFMRNFKNVIDEHRITCLGVCLLPEITKLTGGEIFLEKSYGLATDRRQATFIVAKSAHTDHAFEAIWAVEKENAVVYSDDEKHISISEYNKIPLIADQKAKLDAEMGAVDISGHKLFEALAPVFTDHGPGLALCLVHRHYDLLELQDTDGQPQPDMTERMVSKDFPSSNENNLVSISEPCAVKFSTNQDVKTEEIIFPERWLSNGTIFEYTRNHQPQNNAPTVTFMREFNKVLNKNLITCLGVCLLPEITKLTDEKIFLEKSDGSATDRRQVTVIVEKSELENEPFDTIWAVNKSTNSPSSNQGTNLMEPLRNCTGCNNGKEDCQGPKVRVLTSENKGLKP